MKYLLSCFSDVGEKIWFSPESATITGAEKCKDDVSGYYERIGECFYAFYSIDSDQYFYNGEREIKIEEDFWARFTNVLVDRKSIFEIYRSNDLIWKLSYEAWWANIKAFRPDRFVVEAREEDLEYDFFAYVESKVGKR